jgi:hypothetical protein
MCQDVSQHLSYSDLSSLSGALGRVVNIRCIEPTGRFRLLLPSFGLGRASSWW